MEIQFVHWDIHITTTQLKEILSRLEDTIDSNFYRQLTYWLHRDYNRLHKQTKIRHIMKFRKFDHTINNPTTTNKLDWINNISNTPVPNNILNFLALGPKFSLNYN